MKVIQMKKARFVAHVAFAGNSDRLDPDAAAVALARNGFWVVLLPERYRPQLCLWEDDFLEASKLLSGDKSTFPDQVSAMMDEVAAIVDRFGGDCHYVKEIDDTYTPEFCGLARPVEELKKSAEIVTLNKP